MKLKDGFVLHDVGGEHMAVATGKAGEHFNGLIRNNNTADFIFKMLMKETSAEEITAAMAEHYDAPVEVIAADVQRLIIKLREAGLLDE